MRPRRVATRGAGRIPAAVSCLFAVAALASPPAARASYGWPLAPFDRQHPVRGGFCDPRLGDREQQFHFGVDIASPDGTPVYAVASGVAWVDAARPRTVAVSVGPGHVISYWHVLPVIGSRTFVATHQLIGYVVRGAGHVHLSERIGSDYVNPLRPGALTPYRDETAPLVEMVDVEHRGVELDPAQLSGRVDLVAEVSDVPELALPPPWEDSVLTPATVAWRLLRADGTVVEPLRTVFDCTTEMPQDNLFWSVFAPGTLQNHPGTAGWYRFWLARGLNTYDFLDGDYRLQVFATDVRGNVGTETLPITIRNDAPPTPTTTP
jgi:peptidase M23-like protein